MDDLQREADAAYVAGHRGADDYPFDVVPPGESKLASFKIHSLLGEGKLQP